jgi:antitoxin VapB
MTEPLITRVFQSGNSQAVRLPREFRLETEEVLISKEGNKLIITPRPGSWEGFMAGVAPLSEDFSVSTKSLPADTPRQGFDE